MPGVDVGISVVLLLGLPVGLIWVCLCTVRICDFVLASGIDFVGWI